MAQVITALVDVAAGDELTHAYFEAERWMARRMRRQALASKFFVCGCPRCLGEEHDAARDAPHSARARDGDGGSSSGGGESWVDSWGFRAEAGAAGARRVAEGVAADNHHGGHASPASPTNPGLPSGAASLSAAAWARLSPEELVAHCQQHWAALDAAGVQALTACFERQGLQPRRRGDLSLRPSKLALLGDLHDLMADLHKVIM